MQLLTRKEFLEEKARRLSRQIELIEEELKHFKALTEVETELDDLREQEPLDYPSTPPRAQRNVNHLDEFPEGTKVRFPLATTEKKHLRGKQGIVVGHSPKFVKVEREGKVHLRTPIKLVKVPQPVNDERKEQASSNETQVQKGKGKRGVRKSKTKVRSTRS